MASGYAPHNAVQDGASIGFGILLLDAPPRYFWQSILAVRRLFRLPRCGGGLRRSLVVGARTLLGDEA